MNNSILNSHEYIYAWEKNTMSSEIHEILKQTLVINTFIPPEIQEARKTGNLIPHKDALKIFKKYEPYKQQLFEDSLKKGYIPYAVGYDKSVWYITVDGQYTFTIDEGKNGEMTVHLDKSGVPSIFEGKPIGHIIDCSQSSLEMRGDKYIIPFEKMKVIHSLEEARKYWYEKVEADYNRACEEDDRKYQEWLKQEQEQLKKQVDGVIKE